jgi:hypothetical protein
MIVEIGAALDLNFERTAFGEVRQPKESKLCGQYAAAWVLRVSPFLTIQHLGNDRTFEEEMLLALNRMSWRPDWFTPKIMRPHDPAMLLLKDTIGGLHWIGYRDDKFYDPLQSHKKYAVRAILQLQPEGGRR